MVVDSPPPWMKTMTGSFMSAVALAPDVDKEAVLVMGIVRGLGYAVTCRPKLSCRRSEASSPTEEEVIQDT